MGMCDKGKGGAEGAACAKVLERYWWKDTTKSLENL